MREIAGAPAESFGAVTGLRGRSNWLGLGGMALLLSYEDTGQGSKSIEIDRERLA